MNPNASTTTISRQDLYMHMIPIWLCFISLGIIWSPSYIVSYISSDLTFTYVQTLLFYLPYLFCYFLLPIPALSLIHRFGYKNMLMASLILWIVALIILASDYYYNYSTLVIACSFMAIASPVMLTALYSFITTFFSNAILPSTLSFGQALMPLAATIVPYLFEGANKVMIPTFGFGWRIIFVWFAISSMFALSVLAATPSTISASEEHNFIKTIKGLLRSPSFCKNMSAIAVLTGINLISLLLTINLTSFLLFQAAGLFIGGVTLKNFPPVKVGYLAVAILLLGVTLLWIGENETISNLSFAFIGFSNAPLFIIAISRLFTAHWDKKYAVTGLTVTAISGGIILLITAIVTIAMFGNISAYCILSVSVLIIIWYSIYCD